MFCVNCQQLMTPGDKFCMYCGTKLPELQSESFQDRLEFPRLKKGQRLDLKNIRDSKEAFYFFFVPIPACFLAVVLLYFAFTDIQVLVTIIAVVLFLIAFYWISLKLLFAAVLGDSIKVGPNQYPQIYFLIREACECLGIDPPAVLIMQGHGLFEVLVAKIFSRRGFMILTSNLVDDLTERGSSREMMFFVGRQLGLISTGYFRLWVLKHMLGRFAFLFYLAWQRHCQMTADRIGLLVAGDLYAAEQALLIITSGSSIAPNTNLEALTEQRRELFDSYWSWIQLGLSGYPYMVDRIIRLREFANRAAGEGIQSHAPVAIGALPITHRPIRAVPLMIVHGHDLAARLELENFLLRNLPHVAPVAMIAQTDGARSLPEKFERIASEVKGAVALLTPDDVAINYQTANISERSRQNVIIEVGWFWGRFGRQQCLLLVRGKVELPSDLSGVEVHRYEKSPTECSEVLRSFIASIER